MSQHPETRRGLSVITYNPRLVEYCANHCVKRTRSEDTAVNGREHNSNNDQSFANDAATTVIKGIPPKPDSAILHREASHRPEIETEHASFSPQLTMEDCIRNVAVADLISPIDRNWSVNECRFLVGNRNVIGKSPLLSESQNATSGSSFVEFPSRFTTSDSSGNSSSGVFSDDHITSTVSDVETPRSPSLPVSSRDTDTSESSTGDAGKPPQSYIALIAAAILGSPEKRLILADIYQHVLDNHPYYRSSSCAWRNSIRHNLSVNECFVKSGRARSGRGFYWSVHDACVADFELGDFNRRQARSRVQYASRSLTGSRPAQSPLNRMSRAPPLPTSYVPMTSTPARGYLPQFPGYDRVSPSVLYNNYVQQPMTVPRANITSLHYPRWSQTEPCFTASSLPFFLPR